MKKFCLAIAVLMLCYGLSSAQGPKMEVGSTFDLDKLVTLKKAGVNTIVAFMPSLTHDNDYASMMTQSFHYYFAERLAFDGLPIRPTTGIILIVRDKRDDSRSQRNILDGMSVIYDEDGRLFSAFGLKQPIGKNSDSTVVLLDPNNKISFIDPAYRSQGEHLKPLETKLKGLSGIATGLPSQSDTKSRRIKVGDKAPDFRVNNKEMLSDLRGTVVLLTFYPAAFSGALPKPFGADETQLAMVNFSPPDQQSMSCISQISILDLGAYPTRKKWKPEKTKPTSTPRRIAITSSTAPLLDKWKELLATQNIEYANDPEYAASASYFAFNPAGYNNRVSVIIDQKGKIAYIDAEYAFFDEHVLNRKIDELMNNEN